MVDLEISIENESRSASLPTKQAGSSPEQTSALEDVVSKISGQLSTINRMQKYFRTRENRNFSTVRSTEGRIFRFSLVEVGMMVGMAGLQVMVVRFFFQGARKGNVLLFSFVLFFFLFDYFSCSACFYLSLLLLLLTCAKTGYV
jgi:emp24/gp25L/p24 family/GOLD